MNNGETGLDLEVFVGEGARPVINGVALLLSRRAEVVNESLNPDVRVGASRAGIREKNRSSYITSGFARKVP